MAQEYDNTNTGFIAKNDKKTEDKHPEYRGSAKIQCPHCNEVTDYWQSVWIKTAGQNAKRPGSKFMSVAYQPQEDRNNTSGQPAPKRQTTTAEDSGDIPF